MDLDVVRLALCCDVSWQLAVRRCGDVNNTTAAKQPRKSSKCTLRLLKSVLVRNY